MKNKASDDGGDPQVGEPHEVGFREVVEVEGIEVDGGEETREEDEF